MFKRELGLKKKMNFQQTCNDKEEGIRVEEEYEFSETGNDEEEGIKVEIGYKGPRWLKAMS